MSGGAREEFDLILGSQCSIEMLESSECLLGSSDIKIVPFFGQNDDWLGGECSEKVLVIQSQCNGPRWALLCVGRKLVFEIAGERSDKA